MSENLSLPISLPNQTVSNTDGKTLTFDISESATTSYELIFPATNAVGNLLNDGSGNLSWSTGGGGTSLFADGSNSAPLPVASGTDPNTAVWNQPFELGPADVMLTGGESPFGSLGQGGNVQEWQETDFIMPYELTNLLRGIRGSDWISAINPSAMSSQVTGERLGTANIGVVGFRIAGIPEPSTLLLTMIAGGMLLHRRCRI